MDEKRIATTIGTIVGAVLVFAGFYLPWYSVVFDPPGGLMLLNGHEQPAFTYAYSGLNPSVYTSSNVQFLHTVVIGTVVLGGFALFRLLLALFIPEGTAESIAGGLSTLVTLIQSGFVSAILDTIQALAHIIAAFLMVGFFIVYIGLSRAIYPSQIAANFGGTGSAANAARYSSEHLGIGLLVMFIGFLIGGVAIFRTVAVVAGIVLVIIIGLLLFHASALGDFFHLLGF